MSIMSIVLCVSWVAVLTVSFFVSVSVLKKLNLY